MSKTNPTVMCTVDQCTHYMLGDQCMAASISVYNAEHKGSSERADDTQCKSFHPRKSVGDMVGAIHNANIGGMAAAPFMDGKQVTPSVECFVDNCRYWHSNNLCTAESIEVKGNQAARSEDTDCRTFSRK